MFFKKLLILSFCLGVFFNFQAQENYETICNLHKNSYTNPTDFQSMNLAFSMLALTEDSDLNHYLEACQFKTVDPTIWQDYNFFYGNQKYPQKHILNQINRTQTKVGYATLAKQMTCVKNNIYDLERRQNIVKAFIQDPNFGKIQESLNAFAKVEDSFQFIFDQQKTTETFLKIRDNYFSFKKLKGFNRQPMGLELGRAIPRLYNIVSIFMQIFMLKNFSRDAIHAYISLIRLSNNLVDSSYDLNVNGLFVKIIQEMHNTDSEISKAFSLYIELFSALAFQLKDSSMNLYSLYSSFMKNNDLSILKNFNNAVFQTIEICKQLNDIVNLNPNLQIQLKYLKNIKEVLNNPSESLKKLIEICSSKNRLMSFGNALAGFKLALNCKKELAMLAQAIGEIDMYCSLAKLLNEQNSKNKYCFVHYVNSKLPYVRIDQCWNILLDRQTAVANNAILGEASNGQGHNSVLNGTNESGKSTYQKSILIALILAQSLGIAPANCMELRPFDRIKYYQNIADDILDNKSLFRKQAQEFNKLFTIHPTMVTYLSIDEPATGANARNCAALSFAAARQLQKAPHYVATISTHYPLLMGLEKITNSYFKNYKFTNPESENPYKLVEGISDQHREFDILRKEGLDPKILDEAIEMIRSDRDLKLMPIRSKL